MKRQGDDFIIHGLFLDDDLKQDFMEKYTKESGKDFDITGGGLMKTYLGMQVEQSRGKIRLHLNKYIRETLNE